jgi:hypothetical protein
MPLLASSCLHLPLPALSSRRDLPCPAGCRISRQGPPCGEPATRPPPAFQAPFRNPVPAPAPTPAGAACPERPGGPDSPARPLPPPSRLAPTAGARRPGRHPLTPPTGMPGRPRRSRALPRGGGPAPAGTCQPPARQETCRASRASPRPRPESPSGRFPGVGRPRPLPADRRASRHQRDRGASRGLPAQPAAGGGRPVTARPDLTAGLPLPPGPASGLSDTLRAPPGLIRAGLPPGAGAAGVPGCILARHLIFS